MGRYLGWSSIGYSDEIWPDLGDKHRMVFFSGIIVVFLNGTITERRIILWQMASRKFSTMCHSFYSVTLHLERSIEFMSSTNILIGFLFQTLRTLLVRVGIMTLSLMDMRLRGMVEKEEQLAHASEYFEIPSENEIKMMIASGSKDWAEEIAMQFILKSWLLVSTPPGKSFYIGDNPLAMNNSVKQTFYGNIGPSAPGIEIYWLIVE